MDILHLTKDNYESELKEGNALVDFWASWCGPCRMQAPILEEFAGKHSEVKVCKVDIDAEPELAQKYGVMSIPTLVAFSSLEEKSRLVGVQNLESLESMF